MKLYVASSWRNALQPHVITALRLDGHQVYDFRNPVDVSTGKKLGKGFAWSDVDKDWRGWSPAVYRMCLGDPIAEAGFENDFRAMQWAEGAVLVMPSGRSAHIEAGYFVGAGKPLYILLDGPSEPELMYKMATRICLTTTEVLHHLRSRCFSPFDPTACDVHTGETYPASCHADGDVYHFYDQAGNEIPWHKSFPPMIGDIAAFCAARAIDLV